MKTRYFYTTNHTSDEETEWAVMATIGIDSELARTLRNTRELLRHLPTSERAVLSIVLAAGHEICFNDFDDHTLIMEQFSEQRREEEKTMVIFELTLEEAANMGLDHEELQDGEVEITESRTGTIALFVGPNGFWWETVDEDGLTRSETPIMSYDILQPLLEDEPTQ